MEGVASAANADAGEAAPRGRRAHFQTSTSQPRWRAVSRKSRASWPRSALPAWATNCSITSSSERVPSHRSSSTAALSLSGTAPPGWTSTGCGDALPALRHSTRICRPFSSRVLVRHNTGLVPVPRAVAGSCAGDELVDALNCAPERDFCKVRASPETPFRTLRSSVAMAASRERDSVCHGMRHGSARL